MQVTPPGGRVRRTLTTLRARVGTAALLVLYLAAAAASPSFWRSPRPRPLDGQAVQ